MSDIKSMVRYGIVSAVYPQRATARVAFADRDNLVSAELPVLQSFGLKNKSYRLPDIGESVVCLCPANDDSNGGFIIGSFYHDNARPPAQSQEVSCIKFSDGTSLSYDRASHELRIEVKGRLRIKAERVDIN